MREREKMHKSGKKSDKKGGRQREMGRERVYRYLINRERKREDRVKRKRERERGQSK